MKNTIIKGLFLAGLLGQSLVAMEITQKEPVQLRLGGSKAEWYQEALALKISNPLKVVIANNTNNEIRTIQQGQGNMVWARIPQGKTFEDVAFNMDRWTSEYPQYTIRTAENIYTMNFEKNAPYFKAVLERLDMEPGLGKNASDKEIMGLIALLNKLPVGDVEQIVQGNVLTVTLNNDIATLAVSNA